MNDKYIVCWKFLIPAAGIALIALGYVLAHPLAYGICHDVYKFNDYFGCSDDSIDTIGKPLYTFMTWALWPALLVAVLDAKKVRAFIKFLAWAIPIAFVFTASEAVHPDSGWFGFTYDNYLRVDAAHDIGIVFLIAAAVVLIYSFIAPKNLSERHYNLNYNGIIMPL